MLQDALQKVLAGAAAAAADKKLAPQSEFFVPADALYVFSLK